MLLREVASASPARLRDQQPFFIKGQLTDILGFAGHMVCVSTAQVCGPSPKSAEQSVSEQAWLTVSKALFLKLAVGWMDHSPGFLWRKIETTLPK